MLSSAAVTVEIGFSLAENNVYPHWTPSFVNCASFSDPFADSFSSNVQLTFWEFLVLPKSTSTTSSFYHSPPYFPSDHACNIHPFFHPFFLYIHPPIHSSIHPSIQPTIHPPTHPTIQPCG